MAKYRVLSIDGGGLRGLIPTILLQRIARTPGLETFVDSIDLLAGTSTGGLIAMSIAHGLDLETIRDLYVGKGPKIFDDSWRDDLVDVGKLRGADYHRALRRELKRLFADVTLGRLSKRVLICAFDLDNEDDAHRTWKPKLFHNFPGRNSDRASRAVDVGLYTSAAPTYFPSVDGYIDGMMYAVNPAMCALAQTQDRRYRPTPATDEVLLLSLGTGLSLQVIKGKSHDWGYSQWARPIIKLMLDGTAGIADYQCRQLLGDRYHRLAPVFPPGVTVPMDDVCKIPYMVEFAESVKIDETVDWLKGTWRDHRGSRRSR